DVLLRLAGVDGLQGVPVVGRTDNDGIEVLAIEELAVFAELLGFAADLLRGEVEVGLVDVADGGDLAVLVLQEGVEDLIAAVAQPDDPQPEAFIRAEHPAGAEGSGHGSGGAEGGVVEVSASDPGHDAVSSGPGRDSAGPYLSPERFTLILLICR